MEYSNLGPSGLSVSKLALGTATFGFAAEPFPKGMGAAEAARVVGVAIDAGVNLIDTADRYATGQSEELVGRAVRSAGARDRIVLATKVGGPMSPDPADRGLSFQHIVSACQASLRRLHVQHIDLLQLHNPDFTTPLDESLRALEHLVQRGDVRHVGWCNLPAWYAAEGRALQEALGYASFVSGQFYYSLVGRDCEHEILPYTRHDGLAALIWSPLAGGYLTGKYAGADAVGRRTSLAMPPVDEQHGAEVMEAVAAVAAAHGATPAQVAIAWLMSRPGVTSVILGASGADQLVSNLAAAELDLTGEELIVLDHRTRGPERYPEWLPEYADADRRGLALRVQQPL